MKIMIVSMIMKTMTVKKIIRMKKMRQLKR
jgi:hypothetical protein